MTNYGPRVAWEQLTEGTRVYYTGDIANPDGFGTIAERLPINPRWNYRQVTIRMDDGREMRGIHLAGFDPSPGRRFWLDTDWQADRNARIEAMKAEWAARSCR